MGLLRTCLRAVRELHGGDMPPPWSGAHEHWVHFGERVATVPIESPTPVLHGTSASCADLGLPLERQAASATSLAR